MTPTFGIIPHRTRSSVSVSLCAHPLAVQWQCLDAYGFGPASWEQLEPPSFGVGEPVTITCEGATVHQGRVATVTSADHVAESLRYRVTSAGIAEDLKADETVEGVFVDRDLAQWKTATSGASANADFSIAVDVTDAVHFRFADVEEGLVRVDMAEPTLAYKLPETGNLVPPYIPAYFSPGKPLWSACYYQIGGGATTKRISRVAFNVEWHLTEPCIQGMTTPDYESPEGTPDAKYGHRHSTYPDLGLWLDFHGLSKVPVNCFLGLYCVDDLAELPTSDPAAMYRDPRRKVIFAQGSGDTAELGFGSRVAWDVDCTFVVFYAAYLPIMHPVNLDETYDEAEDHLVRVGWVAMTRYLAEANQWARVYDLEVCAQGYAPLKDGSDDLGRVFDILYPDCSHPAMRLPPASDTDAPRSIALRTPTTMLAAIAELLALHEDEFSWGIWDGGELVIARPGSAAGVSVADEPGVDTSGCGTSDEGAVDLVQVAYALPATAADPGTLTAPRLGMLVVDASGAYELVDETWEPTPGARVAFRDASGEANCAEAAAKIGQSVAIERRPGQATGTIALRAIAGASTFRTGGLASGPGVPADAKVTAVAVSVDSDAVSVSLGARGYEGRFQPRVAGKPATASPSMAVRPASALETRRLVTRK